jgi:hypothetical protein
MDHDGALHTIFSPVVKHVMAVQLGFWPVLARITINVHIYYKIIMSLKSDFLSPK